MAGPAALSMERSAYAVTDSCTMRSSVSLNSRLRNALGFHMRRVLRATEASGGVGKVRIETKIAGIFGVGVAGSMRGGGGGCRRRWWWRGRGRVRLRCGGDPRAGAAACFAIASWVER